MNTALLSVLLASSPWAVQLDLAHANARAGRSEAHGRVRYAQVYPGIHLESYRAGEDLEYDFIVEPGADPRRIAMRFAAASIEPNGDLVADAVRHHAPDLPKSSTATGGSSPAARAARRGRGGSKAERTTLGCRSSIDPVVTSSRFVNSPFDSGGGVSGRRCGQPLFRAD